MALSRNVGNLLGRVASNHITQEISSSKTSITQAINLGRVAIASNHVPQKISPPFVERVTVEASDDDQDLEGWKKREDRGYYGYGGSGSSYWDESHGGGGRGGANDSGGKLTDADNHGRDSGDGGGIGFWEWLTGGSDGGDGGGDSGGGGGDNGGDGGCGGGDGGGGGGDCGGGF